MIRTTITIISLAFATVIFIWSQLHWHFLKERNLKLEGRLNFFVSYCSEAKGTNEKLYKRNIFLTKQLHILDNKRPNRKKYLAELKKLIHERNIQFGIGGN